MVKIDQLMSALLVRLGALLLIIYPAVSVSQTDVFLSQQPLYIGVEPRNAPYISNKNGEVFEGILIDKALELCQKIKRNCIFSPGSAEELSDALRYNRLEAIIVVDQIVSDSQAEGLFFSPPFCTTRPVLIRTESVSSSVDSMSVDYQSIGVLENSYLEFYLQNHFPSNINLTPYALMENAMFDLFIGKIDAILSDMAFFRNRAEGAFLDNVYYQLPAVAMPLADYAHQPERAMTLVIRDSNTVLKEQISGVTQENIAYCADFLPYQSESPDAAGN